MTETVKHNYSAGDACGCPACRRDAINAERFRLSEIGNFNCCPECGTRYGACRVCPRGCGLGDY